MRHIDAVLISSIVSTYTEGNNCKEEYKHNFTVLTMFSSQLSSAIFYVTSKFVFFLVELWSYLSYVVKVYMYYQKGPQFRQHFKYTNYNIYLPLHRNWLSIVHRLVKKSWEENTVFVMLMNSPPWTQLFIPIYLYMRVPLDDLHKCDVFKTWPPWESILGETSLLSFNNLRHQRRHWSKQWFEDQ